MRLDLDAPHTSAAVRALLWAAARELLPGAPPPKEATILTVLSTFKAPSFVPLPPLPATAEGEGGYNQLTSFPEGLAAFAGVPLEEARTPGVAEAALRGAEARLDAAATAAARAVLASGPQEEGSQEVAGGAGEAWRPRLGAMWDGASLRRYAVAAGFGSGEYGAPLASLAAAATAAATAAAGSDGAGGAAGAGGDGVDGAGVGVMELDESGEQRIAPGAGHSSQAGTKVTSGAAAGAAAPLANAEARRAAAALLASPQVAAANAEAQRRVAAVQPTLRRVQPASEVIRN